MEFPRFVFISPGKNKCGGGTYDHEVVEDQANYDAALAAGYFATVPEAVDAANAQPEAEPKAKPEPDDKPKRGRPAKDKE
jgi:hypothetical protein